jgi:hypothetical protein
LGLLRIRAILSCGGAVDLETRVEILRISS